jgi:hypothetical protein
METREANDVIARREFHLDGNPSGTPEVSVLLYRPQRKEDGYYRCEYEIISSTVSRTGYDEGLDTIHALLGALRLIGSWIARVDESVYNGRLRWDDCDQGQFGLPTLEDRCVSGMGQSSGEVRENTAEDMDGGVSETEPGTK